MTSHVLRYGSPEQELVDLAVQNFTGATFADPSFCTTPVEVLSLDGNDTVLAHASGFFWRHDILDYVVTNWHVMSGRNPFNREIIDRKNLLVPKRLRVYGWKISTYDGRLDIKRTPWTVDMGDAGQEIFSNAPVIDGRVVDIAAIPLPPNFVLESHFDASGYEKFGNLEPRVNLRLQDEIETMAGDECVLLGYPLSQYSGLKLPIWKRGSLATETNMSVDGSPAFLIDAATSSAMSGSPIFRRVSMVKGVRLGTKIVEETRAFQFIGVYAGRLQSPELSAINVGYGWFSNQVDLAVAHSWSTWQAVAAERRSVG